MLAARRHLRPGYYLWSGRVGIFVRSGRSLRGTSSDRGITGAPPLPSIQQRALLHHTLSDGNYENMLNCYREFTVAQARIEPANARQEIDRVLRTCWIEKRPVYL